MSEPLQTPAAPEAAGGAPLSAPSAPIASTPPAPVSASPPTGGAPPIPGLASEPPEVQRLVNRAVSTFPGAVPANPAPVAPAVAPPSPPPVQSDPFVQGLIQAGLPIQPTAQPADVAAAVQQLLPMARQWNLFQRQHGQTFQQYLQSQGMIPGQAPASPTPAAPPAQPEAPEDYWAKAWPVPPLDPRVAQMIDRGILTRDQHGLFVVAPEHVTTYPASYAEQANQWEDATRNAKREYAANPLKYTWDKFQPQLEEYVQKRVEQVLSQRDSQISEAQAVQTFEQQHASWMFEGAGQVRDPVTGYAIPTPEGQFVINEANDLMRQGFSKQAALQRAAERLELALYRQQQAAPAAPATTPVPAPAPAQPATPFLANAAKVQQALHNPSFAPQPQVPAVTPRVMSWDGLGTHVKSLLKTLPAA